MITIQNFSYSYPNTSQPALQDVSWEVQLGEFILVAGPSGSGKSTLLRCLNGLVPHFTGGGVQGQVVVNGLNVLQAGPQQMSRHVGFVWQNPEAQAVLDRVEPEIAFGLENAAIPPAEMRVRVEEVLDLLDLAKLRERPLSTLSGGERQRVAIATALALRPSILVLDEPTSQLDPQSADDVLRALVRLNEDLGLTIILAEHRLERVLKYVDRVTYLENGRILTDAPVRQAVAHIPQLPPLVHLGKKLNWQPLPLTVKEAKQFASLQVCKWASGQVGKWASGQVGKSLTIDDLPLTIDHSSPFLTAQNLHYAYNGQPALNGVSLQLHAGEAVVVMGRNGSGKSTLLKCLVGLLQPKQGDVKVNGRSTQGRDVADICREVAYLPQNPDDLLFAETVGEELMITLRNHGREPVISDQYSVISGELDVACLLGELGLAEVAQAYPRDLSVGQRQRVALGAVTVTHPRILLLDEPTRGLDYAAKEQLVAIWRHWLAKGMGLLLVTHDVELAALVADWVMVMSQGEVIAAGKTAEILPASPLFAPQIARLFPGTGWLTAEDALKGMMNAE